MAESCINILAGQTLSFIKLLGPLILLAGTFEAFAGAASWSLVHAGRGRIYAICRRYALWLLAGMAVVLAANALAGSLGRGGLL